MTSVPVLLAAVLFFSALAGAWGIDRAWRRRARTRGRELEHDLAGRFVAVLGGRGDRHELEFEAEACDAGTLWSALESLTPKPRERRAIGIVLARNRHLAAECLALRDDSPWRRELAARRLALVAAPLARRALREALAAGPEVVTHAAGLALARHRDRASLEWLIAHPQSIARRTPRARVTLFRAFGPGALPLLAETVARPGMDPAIVRAAIECLGLADPAGAVEVILPRLADPTAEVRIAAARALGRLRAGTACDALIAALEDPEWTVRAQAAWALGRLGEPAAVQALPRRLADSAFWVRRHAARALAALGEPGREVLRRVAAASPDPYARDASRAALDAQAEVRSA